MSTSQPCHGLLSQLLALQRHINHRAGKMTTAVTSPLCEHMCTIQEHVFPPQSSKFRPSDFAMEPFPDHTNDCYLQTFNVLGRLSQSSIPAYPSAHVVEQTALSLLGLCSWGFLLDDLYTSTQCFCILMRARCTQRLHKTRCMPAITLFYFY